MSRWLSSVNNLLDQFDGQAENVATGDFLRDGAGALSTLIEKATNTAGSVDGASSVEYYTSDGDEAEYSEVEEEDMVEEVIEENLVADGDDDEYFEEEIMTASIDDAIVDGDEHDEVLWSSCEGEPPQGEATNSIEEDFSLPVPPQGKRVTSTGDVVDEDAVSDITEEGNSNLNNNDDLNSTDGEFIDVPPKTPNRQHSSKKKLAEVSAARATGASCDGNDEATPLVAGEKISPEVDRSDKTDLSPRQPRRSLNKTHAMISTTATDLGQPVEGEETNLTSHSDPPKLPTRQASNTQPAPATEPNLSLQMTIARDRDASSPAAKSVDNVKVTSQGNSSRVNPPTKVASKPKEVKVLTAKVNTLQAQMKKIKCELKSSQSEGKNLEQTVSTLTAELEAAKVEIDAQGAELLRAGERMENDRTRAQAEISDLLDDHDDELDQLKATHATEMAEQRAEFERQIEELRQELTVEEKIRVQEGVDLTKELEDAIQREKDALVKLSQVESEKNELQRSTSKLELQQEAMQTKIESLVSAAKTAAERERQTEDKLDAAVSLHARQTGQHKAREAELERNIFELGSALTVARQQTNVTVSQAATTQLQNEATDLKDHFEQAVAELDAAKAQLDAEKQRTEALIFQLDEISKERTEEASSLQAMQRQHDVKIADMELIISRLQDTIRGLKNGEGALGANSQPATDGNIAKLLEKSQKADLEIADLSEQLLRQQDRFEASKSEILALKERLKAATARAEDAERSLDDQSNLSSFQPNSTGRMYEMEGGGIGYSNNGMRRRVKGGSTRLRGGSSSTRSIRSALKMTNGRSSPQMEQVANTLDALDNWMLQTGAFLRHEPLARLVFLLYLLMLHMWSFALVVFHTMEQPHGDFGSMGNNPRNWRPRP